MEANNSATQPRRMRLYLWAAALVLAFGAVLMATGYFVTGAIIAAAGLVTAIFVYRRRSRGGYAE